MYLIAEVCRTTASSQNSSSEYQNDRGSASRKGKQNPNNADVAAPNGQRHQGPLWPLVSA